jgi:hypothetical protein
MNARSWEFIVFTVAFVGRMVLSLRERRPYNFCADGLTYFLEILATLVLFYPMIIYGSFFWSKFDQRVPALSWKHSWIVRTRLVLYIFATAALPSCFLSQLMLQFWRYK